MSNGSAQIALLPRPPRGGDGDGEGYRRRVEIVVRIISSVPRRRGGVVAGGRGRRRRRVRLRMDRERVADAVGIGVARAGAACGSDGRQVTREGRGGARSLSGGRRPLIAVTCYSRRARTRGGRASGDARARRTGRRRGEENEEQRGDHREARHPFARATASASSRLSQ